MPPDFLFVRPLPDDASPETVEALRREAAAVFERNGLRYGVTFAEPVEERAHGHIRFRAPVAALSNPAAGISRPL